jgi:hypothetical protein
MSFITRTEALNAKPEYGTVNLPSPFKQQIARARCLLATAERREEVVGHQFVALGYFVIRLQAWT